MSKPKKKFKETKVGKFLLGKSGIIDVISNILPDQGALGMVKNLIHKDPDLPPQDKETALALEKKVSFVHLPIWFCLIVVYFINLILRSRSPVSTEQVLRMKEDKVFSWDDAFTDFGFSPMSFKDGIRLEVDELIK